MTSKPYGIVLLLITILGLPGCLQIKSSPEPGMGRITPTTSNFTGDAISLSATPELQESPVSTVAPTSSPDPARCLVDLDHRGLGKIAYTSDQDGDDEIYVMDADGNNIQQLTDNPAYDA